MKIQAFLLGVSLSLSSLAIADTTKKPDAAKTTESAKLADDDVKLVAHVKHVNAMEIDMGKLAQANGGAGVKKYGAMLVKDHTANDKTLLALAKKKGLATIPDEVPATEDAKKEHQAMMDGMAKLKTLKGAEFDAAFLTMMAADHDKEVARLEAGATTAKDADLAAFLKATKPVVQGHADKARSIQKGA